MGKPLRPNASRFRGAIRGCDRSLEARGDTVPSADTLVTESRAERRAGRRFAVANNLRRGNLITGNLAGALPYYGGLRSFVKEIL